MAPWKDFAGAAIREGDTIRHSTGETGRVVYLPAEENESDRWRVDYGDGVLSRLCLQIGEKGMAVVSQPTAAPEPLASILAAERELQMASTRLLCLPQLSPKLADDLGIAASSEAMNAAALVQLLRGVLKQESTNASTEGA